MSGVPLVGFLRLLQSPHPRQKSIHGRQEVGLYGAIDTALSLLRFLNSPSVVDIEDKCQRLIKHAFFCRECHVRVNLSEQN